MASAAAEVALHCMICYEEFDLKDHHPVVLPCGHTYVCIVCAKRLKKCMECREPLFWNPPKPTPPQNNNNLHRSPAHPRYSRPGRMSAARYSPSPQTPPHPSMQQVEKKEEHPLPLPKNVVLMEMIEAKERQQRLLQEARRQEQEALLRKQELQLQQLQDELESGATTTHNMNLMDTEADDEDEDEENELLLDPALSGMAAFTGACGTYVVREPLGLVVLPQDPNRKHQQPAVSPGASPAAASHVGAVVSAGFGEEHEESRPQKIPLDDDGDHDEKKEPEDDHHPGNSNNNLRPSHSRREPFSLEEGQKVQVVGVEEGVYQLARGAGYIVATVNQLVKGELNQ